MKSSTANLIIAALIGFVVGVGGTALYNNRTITPADQNNTGLLDGANTTGSLTGTNTSNGTTTATGTSTGSMVSIDPNAPNTTFIVPNQRFGDKVVVETARVSKPTWIAIADDVNGAPGRILGARLMQPTDSTIEVFLQRPTVLGNIYRAVQYDDVNGNGGFEVGIDKPRPASAENPVVQVSFTAL